MPAQPASSGAVSAGAPEPGSRRSAAFAHRAQDIGADEVAISVNGNEAGWMSLQTLGLLGAVLGDEVDGGRPSFVSSDIPPVGQIDVKQPRIYFGEESPSYSIVGSPKGIFKMLETIKKN